MTTADFLARAGADAITPIWWIEIEGIRRRYSSHEPAWNPEDSGTERHLQPYMTRLPQITGQVAEPLNGSTTPHEFTIDLLDVDEEITELFSAADTSGGLSTLVGNHAAGDVTIEVADGTEYTVGGDIYIDRETMRVTGVAANILTVIRGMYGSEDVAHNVTDDQDNPRIVYVYTSPPFMYTREVTLVEGRIELEQLLEGSPGYNESDAIRFRGYLDSADENEGVYTLRCAGYLRRLNCMICESLAQTTLAIDLWDERLIVWSGERAERGLGATTWAVFLTKADHFAYQAESGHMIIDEEIIKYESIDLAELYFFDRINLSTDTTFNSANMIASAANRGLFAKEILGPGAIINVSSTRDVDIPYTWYDVSKWCVEHYIGAPVREIFHSQKIKDELSLTDTESLKASDVILTMLLSQTGDGSNDATYDKLPEGWGAGIPAAKIDITGIENICAHPSVAGIDFSPFAIVEPTDCKDWLEEHILRPCHLFFMETDEGKISVRRLYSKNEAEFLETATALTEDDDLLEIPKFKPGQAPIGQISINVNWHPGMDEFLGKVNIVLGNGRQHYLSTARKFEIDCKTVYDSRVGIGRGQWISGDLGDLPDVLGPYIEVIFKNFALVPCPVVSFPVSYAQLVNVQLGQVITLTSPQTPDMKNSDRGFNAEYFQVVEAHPNPEQSSVDLVCWMIGIHDANTRPLAPAAKIKAYDAGPPVKFTLELSYFADGVKYTYDVDAFEVLDDVMLVDAGYDGLGGVAPEHAPIVAKNSGPGANDCWITFAVAPPNPPGAPDIAAGAYVVTSHYDDCVAAQKAKWAYLGDATPTLGAADDDPHRYDR